MAVSQITQGAAPLQANIKAPDIEGLLPAVDPRKVGKALVVDGQNFLWDINGPYSGFGNRVISKQLVYNAENAYTFRVDGKIYIFTDCEILDYDGVDRKSTRLNSSH